MTGSPALPARETTRLDPRPEALSARTFRGGCECGAVLYEVALDPARPWKWPDSVWERAVPARAFRLLTGDESLRGYQFFAGGSHDFFCERCGVRSFSRHAAESHADFYSIDLKCLHTTW